MLRALAMISVFLGCTYWGIRASSLLRLRRDTLSAFKSSVNHLCSRMSYSAQPLALLAEQAKTKETEVFWSLFSKRLAIEDDVSTAWKSAMEYARENDAGFASLKIQELRIFEDYAKGLGSSDSTMQTKNGAWLQQRLDSVMSEANDAYNRKGRMFRSIGILTGVAAALLLW